MPITSFQDWANRLLVGPRPIVMQQLADIAAQRRERAQAARKATETTEGRQFSTSERLAGEQFSAGEREARERARASQALESTRAQYREQERVTLAKEARERAEAGSLSRLTQMLQTGQPSGEPSPPPAREELFRFGKEGREVYKTLFPTPPKPGRAFTHDPTKELRGPAGELLESAQPTPYEPEKVTGLMRHADIQAQLERDTGVTPEGWDHPVRSSLDLTKRRGEIYMKMGQGLATARFEGVEEAKGRLPFSTVEPGSMLVHRRNLEDVTSQPGLTYGAGNTMVLSGEYAKLAPKAVERWDSIKGAQGHLQRIYDVGQRIFTQATARGVTWQGTKAFFQKPWDVGLGKEARKLQQMEGTVFAFAGAMQSDSRISDKDAEIVLKLMSIDSLYQSQDGFETRVAVVNEILNRVLRRLVHDEKVDRKAGVTIPGLEELERKYKQIGPHKVTIGGKKGRIE